MAFVAVFQWARFPAALLLGPMLTAVLLAVNGGRLQVPDWVFQIGQGVVACMIARTMTAPLRRPSGSGATSRPAAPVSCDSR